MSSLSHPYTHGLDWVASGVLNKITKMMEGFFRSKEITKIAKIYHDQFSYDLVPDTAIKDFYNMKKVTSLDSGDCFIYVFEEPQYQGHYQIIKPGEKCELSDCGSIVVSMQPVPIDAVKDNASPPPGFWELSGPMYIFHLSSGYRYA